jgi:hypothetical protein
LKKAVHGIESDQKKRKIGVRHGDHYDLVSNAGNLIHMADNGDLEQVKKKKKKKNLIALFLYSGPLNSRRRTATIVLILNHRTGIRLKVRRFFVGVYFLISKIGVN